MKKKSRTSKGRKSSSSTKGTGSSPLDPTQLRWSCPDEFIPGKFSDLPPATATVGQPRAIDALRLGLTLRSEGYNVYAAGFEGTGRSTSVMQIIRSLAPDYCPVLKDYAYVHSFKSPNAPRLVTLPAGRGVSFQRAVAKLVSSLRSDGRLEQQGLRWVADG